MPMESEAQRRYLHKFHPELAQEFEAKTPKGVKLPKRKTPKKPKKVKSAALHGMADALEHFGFKTAAQELRLKIPRREFHGLKSAFGPAAESLSQRLSEEPNPNDPQNPNAKVDPLAREVLWGSPSNPAAGDAGSRISDLGQPATTGPVF